MIATINCTFIRGYARARTCEWECACEWINNALRAGHKYTHNLYIFEWLWTEMKVEIYFSSEVKISQFHEVFSTVFVWKSSSIFILTHSNVCVRLLPLLVLKWRESFVAATGKNDRLCTAKHSTHHTVQLFKIKERTNGSFCSLHSLRNFSRLSAVKTKQQLPCLWV